MTEHDALLYFANDVTNSLNKSGVKGPEGFTAGMFLVIFDRDETKQPVAGSLNYIDGVWTLNEQLAGMEKVDGTPEKSKPPGVAPRGS